MSNDTKFWGLRLAALLLFSLQGSAILKLAFAAGSTPRSTGRVIVWAAVCLVLFGISMVVYTLYRKAKIERWKDTQPIDQNGLEVETLAAYAKQQEVEKHKPEQR